VIIVESKSLADYVNQLAEMGEDPEEYDGLFGFSLGETEDRLPLYEYPEYEFKVTPQLTNIRIPN
jgi:lysine 2,3-aminomutase